MCTNLDLYTGITWFTCSRLDNILFWRVQSCVYLRIARYDEFVNFGDENGIAFYSFYFYIVLLRLSKSVPKPRFFRNTVSKRNRDFMPICWRFWKQSSSSVLTVRWTLNSRPWLVSPARLAAGCYHWDQSRDHQRCCARRGTGCFERLNEWRRVETVEGRRWSTWSTTDVFTCLLTLQVWGWMKQVRAGHSYHLNYLFILPLWSMASRH